MRNRSYSSKVPRKGHPPRLAIAVADQAVPQEPCDQPTVEVPDTSAAADQAAPQEPCDQPAAEVADTSAAADQAAPQDHPGESPIQRYAKTTIRRRAQQAIRSASHPGQ